MKQEDIGDLGVDVTTYEGSDSVEKNPLTYPGYLAAGKVIDEAMRINEADYQNALLRARETSLNEISGPGKSQATGMLKFCELDPSMKIDDIDVRVLYDILRSEGKPEGVVHHHVQMSDQVLMREVLLMLEQGPAVKLLEDKYQNIFGEPGE